MQKNDEEKIELLDFYWRVLTSSLTDEDKKRDDYPTITRLPARFYCYGVLYEEGLMNKSVPFNLAINDFSDEEKNRHGDMGLLGSDLFIYRSDSKSWAKA
jgi:hypothetical protein